jgi:hypothetical protein
VPQPRRVTAPCATVQTSLFGTDHGQERGGFDAEKAGTQDGLTLSGGRWAWSAAERMAARATPLDAVP